MKFLALSLGAAALLAFGACNKVEESTATATVAAHASPPAATPVAAQTGPALPSLGKAPAWHLKDLQGHDVSSDQFKGKVVVVDFWATWCGPCREEIPGYVELQKKYGADGLEIVGVAVNEPDVATVQKFVQDNGLDYHIVMADEDVIQAFGGMDAIPTTFLIDRDGTIRDHKVGTVATADYEQRILKVLKPGI